MYEVASDFYPLSPPRGAENVLCDLCVTCPEGQGPCCNIYPRQGFLFPGSVMKITFAPESRTERDGDSSGNGDQLKQLHTCKEPRAVRRTPLPTQPARASIIRTVQIKTTQTAGLPNTDSGKTGEKGAEVRCVGQKQDLFPAASPTLSRKLPLLADHLI